MMRGPTLEFFVEKDARPHAICTPATVPVYWKEKLREYKEGHGTGPRPAGEGGE